MSQFDFGTIDPFVVDGVQLADMLNQWRDAIYSMSRGAARPSYVVPGMMWINDSAGPTSWVVNVYFGPTVGDKPLFTYDTTTGAIALSASSGGTFTAAVLLAQANASPMVRWNATGNPIDQKDWRSIITPTGSLRFSRYNDAGVEQNFIQFNADGSNSLIPPGTMWDFGGAAAPTGWYLCDGTAISRTADAPLFTAIGTTFGIGDGATTFNVPDTRGRVTAGPDPTNLRLGNGMNGGFTVSGGAVRGAVAGEQAHQLTNLESPPSLVSVASNGPQVGAMNFGDGASPVFFTAAGTHNNTQPTLIVNKIIKR